MRNAVHRGNRAIKHAAARANRGVMRRCSRFACVASIALFYAPAIADCKLEIKAELPVALFGLHPLITAKIDGSDVPVVFDSGAAFNLLSYDAATKLHLRLHSLRDRVTVSGVGGEGRTLLALAVTDVRLGAVRVADAKFIISGAQIGSAAGFIGNGILRKFDIDYDLTGGVVKLARASGCDGVPFARLAEVAAFFRSRHGQGRGFTDDLWVHQWCQDSSRVRHRREHVNSRHPRRGARRSNCTICRCRSGRRCVWRRAGLREDLGRARCKREDR